MHSYAVFFGEIFGLWCALRRHDGWCMFLSPRLQNVNMITLAFRVKIAEFANKRCYNSTGGPFRTHGRLERLV